MDHVNRSDSVDGGIRIRAPSHTAAVCMALLATPMTLPALMPTLTDLRCINWIYRIFDEMKEGRPAGEDELLDLNKKPIERKRKKIEVDLSANVTEGSSNGFVGRVLRSRTMAMTDGEKQVIKMEIGKIEEKDEGEMLVLRKRRKMKGRRGRPPKNKNGDCGLSFGKKDEKLMVQKTLDERNKGAGQERKKVKGRRGRPPKLKDGISGIVLKKIKSMRMKDKGIVVNGFKKNGDNMKAGVGGSGKRIKVDPEEALGAEGKEKGRREEKQLVRDQIVSMLKKAGWTIEYRQRQSKDYKDAVYVDREGRTYWSVTLAYRKLKERIDDGNADAKDVAVFSPIPEEVLSMLFRKTQKGKKAKIKKEGAESTSEGITRKKSSKSKSLDRRRKKAGSGSTSKGITIKESSKSKSLGRGIKSRLNRGKRGTLCARRPGEGSDGENDELYEGKRWLLSWMMDLGTVQSGAKVSYRRRKNTKVTLEGKITRDGICCDCCDKLHTIWDFESHAGSGLRKPYKNIYLESGVSLFQCLIDSWTKHLATDHIGFVSVDINGDDPNDDICNICGDGGDLMCCDACPSAFHNVCLGIEKVPSGDWICVCCSCKFCGVAGRITSKTDDDQDSVVSELFMCRLCEEKFHMPCIHGKDAIYFDYHKPSFCGPECQNIFDNLQVLLGVIHELEEGYSYTILQHHDVSSNASSNGDSLAVESNAKLALAFSVMDECFLPIIDHQCGKNIIHNIVYSCGSNLKRLNYSGFFTIILEKGDELVAAASIRIHGSQLAEMPFIGTRLMYRRQGMCSRLLMAIETVLGSLGVEKLVIPAISELNETWTEVFDFVPLEESKRQEMRFMSTVAFPGIKLLQKPLLKQTLQEEPTEDIGGLAASDFNTSSDVKVQNRDEVAVAVESDLAASDFNTSSEVEIQNGNEVAPVELGASIPNGSLAMELTEVGMEHQSMQEDPNKDIGGRAASDINTTTEVKIQNHDEVAVFNSDADVTKGSLSDASDIKIVAVDVRESFDNEKLSPSS
ncbi:Acyl-CoA N-acyltransferase with RING/FYVE/PHD-type zinc finger protein [Abeliophyllum distichum]|uniref:Acyl-CoA N-acyltransferase with RING/FYVE/PHD-type zinc finger protein n=1 Tax=Abeliophyllum distichum TaxID=126358 RepID=A0ABD1TKC2_9LAMI